MQVGGVELTSEDLTWLEQQGHQEGRARSELAGMPCERKNLLDARGRRRVVAVRIALGRHARAGRLKLPASRPPAPPRSRRTGGVRVPKQCGFVRQQEL